jgi:hypothetical protein
MAELKVIGRSFGSDTLATLEDDGSWKIIVTMTEKRQVEGQDWEEKKISTMCTNKAFEKAYSVALDSTLRQFEDEVKKTGSDSLFPNDVKEVETS